MSETKNGTKASNYLSEKEIKVIAKKYFNEHAILQNYSIDFASQNMLGFLCDYLRLSVFVTNEDANKKQVLNCFIKTISKSNNAKAEMVKELKLYEKESKFYTNIVHSLQIPGIKAWCPKLIVSLDDALVFEDLNTVGYRMRNKLETFDDAHILQALQTLARFHASSIIYEEQKSMEFNRTYRICETIDCFDRGGYMITDPWFSQCMTGALEVVKSHSKYASNQDIIDMCVKKWRDVWKAALELTEPSSKYRNVICHRDLWNNNMMFHYEGSEPDDCLLVDFQAAKYHPPAGDVVLALYCNLEASYREKNFNVYLEYYHNVLHDILRQNSMDINNILSLNDLQESAKQFRLWGLVTTACLVPQFWLNNELTTKIFTDSDQFSTILSHDKASFIRKMCDENEEYRFKVLDIFEEIVKEYILKY